VTDGSPDEVVTPAARERSIARVAEPTDPGDADLMSEAWLD
jgi:hypothetical protein